MLFVSHPYVVRRCPTLTQSALEAELSALLLQEARRSLRDLIPAIGNEQDAKAEHSFMFGMVTLE